jgi:hypothetical protein
MLAIKYNVKIIQCHKYHCELNAIEGLWCNQKVFVRSRTDKMAKIAYLSYSPKIYEKPFTSTTAIAILMNDMAYNINDELSTCPEFIDKTAANLNNIKMIIGGGDVIKPDYFRDGFALINNERSNIHNYLTIHSSQQLYHQLKHI